MERVSTLREGEAYANRRIREIREREDGLPRGGTVYYVSLEGCDASDGLTPKTAWQTPRRVSSAALVPGDAVLFRRGDTFRDTRTAPLIEAKSGVLYGAYGEGEKPCLIPWRSLGDPSLWRETERGSHIFRWEEPIPDVGTLVFNEGEECARKLIPSYRCGRFVRREDESVPFLPERELTEDLDLYWHFEGRMTTRPSRGEDFPVPDPTEALGTLFLRCDRGNPALVFRSIEAAVRRHGISVGENDFVRVENLAIKYAGMHGIAAGSERLRGLHVRGCEIGWIGGTIQNYLGCDPNYPEGGRGSVTRFGNAVEIYGGCDDYIVEDCYLYECYDAGATHQVSTNGHKRLMTNILYKNNVIERCVYGIEYFLDLNEGEDGSAMENVKIEENVFWRSGDGWGRQRHNKHTPAHIKGWSYHNRAKDFLICDNLFLLSSVRMLHLVAREEESLPRLRSNTYLERPGGTLGRYGANGGSPSREPPERPFDRGAEALIRDVLGDREAKVLFTAE